MPEVVRVTAYYNTNTFLAWADEGAWVEVNGELKFFKDEFIHPDDLSQRERDLSKF